MDIVAMDTETQSEIVHDKQSCTAGVTGIRDALYVLNGKWKLPLIFSLSGGPMRFKDIQRSLGDITPKILTKELKELELNEFVVRNVFSTTPVTITYQLTPYSQSLDRVLLELKDWGIKHRQRIVASRKSRGIKLSKLTH
ncbi:helix-turn-helix transcriptional regulator [Mucilaginibacter sp. S1162]|uniref:Helix-turn-helix transcriptional regulator n=1 Tax=Mucilaginibacter humi TaxID=2732510 RepID=A0ABX1W3I9_9SPHI|nr:helix-turn-helix domain-containing protein [Mucilaginibacter humi]NNU33151.1 helix-turn-helix transcriptional regulator [Mucilaginibacter humi]